MLSQLVGHFMGALPPVTSGLDEVCVPGPNPTNDFGRSCPLVWCSFWHDHQKSRKRDKQRARNWAVSKTKPQIVQAPLENLCGLCPVRDEALMCFLKRGIPRPSCRPSSYGRGHRGLGPVNQHKISAQSRRYAATVCQRHGCGWVG